MANTIRPFVWPLLLGVLTPRAGREARLVEQAALRERYETLNRRGRDLLGVRDRDGAPAAAGGAGAGADGAGAEEEASRSGLLDDSQDFEEVTEGEAETAISVEDAVDCRRRILLDITRVHVPEKPLSRKCNAADLGAVAGLDPEVRRTVAECEYFNAFQACQAARLGQLLLAYAIHDPECNYCQGMSDIALPFVLLFADDSLAFWCFEKLMQQARHNFRQDEVGVQYQLDCIRHTLEIVRPGLAAHIAGIGVEEYHFAYRMVLVLLRRELGIFETMRVWEQTWAIDGLNDDFVNVILEGANAVMDPGMFCFIVAGIVVQNEERIRDECRSEDDLLQLFSTCKVEYKWLIRLGRRLREIWTAKLPEVPYGASL